MERLKTTHQKWLQYLIDKKLVSSNNQETIERFLYRSEEGGSHQPWYIQMFSGFGAWLSATFFIIFLGIAGLLESAAGLVGLGVMMCLGAAVLRRNDAPSVFTYQLGLAASIAGKILIASGVMWDGGFDAMIFTIILVELVTFFLYPDTLQRFLTIPVITAAIAVNIFRHRAEEIGIPLLASIFVIVVSGLWWKKDFFYSRYMRIFHQEVSYGAAASLLGLLVIGIFPSGVYWLPVSIIGSLAFLGTIFLILQENERSLLHPRSIAVCLTIIVIGFITHNTPGLIISLWLLVLGFHHRETLLAREAVAFLVVFVIFYYYSLHVTLLQKSFILMGSGVVLLTLMFFLHQSIKKETR